MGADTVVFTHFMKWVIGLFTLALTGLASFMFKSMHCRIKDSESGIRENSEAIAKLEETAVTEDRVRGIVKDELEQITSMTKRIEKHVEKTSAAIERLHIETAILKDRDERGK